MNWTLAVFPCLFLILLNAQDASTKDLNREKYAGKIQHHERRMGPFKIHGREFTVILNLMKYQGASKDFDETVKSFSIVDKQGEVHYQKSFDVEYGNGRFAESLAIWTYALDSREKGFPLSIRKTERNYHSGRRECRINFILQCYSQCTFFWSFMPSVYIKRRTFDSLIFTFNGLWANL